MSLEVNDLKIVIVGNVVQWAWGSESFWGGDPGCQLYSVFPQRGAQSLRSEWRVVPAGADYRQEAGVVGPPWGEDATCPWLILPFEGRGGTDLPDLI